MPLRSLSALILRLPAGLLSSSMPLFTPKASVRPSWPCLLLDSIPVGPRRLGFPNLNVEIQVCDGILIPFMPTQLSLLDMILYMAPAVLRLV